MLFNLFQSIKLGTLANRTGRLATIFLALTFSGCSNTATEEPGVHISIQDVSINKQHLSFLIKVENKSTKAITLCPWDWIESRNFFLMLNEQKFTSRIITSGFTLGKREVRPHEVFFVKCHPYGRFPGGHCTARVHISNDMCVGEKIFTTPRDIFIPNAIIDDDDGRK